jgi:hypothetical protein
MLVSEPAKQEYERLFHGPRKTHDTTEGADDDYDEDFPPTAAPRAPPELEVPWRPQFSDLEL